MPVTWSGTEIAKLLQSIVVLGRSLKAPRSGNEFQTAFADLRTQLDWRSETSPEWAKRILQNAVPQSHHALEQLLWVLDPLFRSNQVTPSASLLVDLGQIVWDLRNTLDTTTQFPGWVDSELEKMWPIRPSLPHLHQISIQNFRCLRKVQVPLRPLTVLIGRNDTGKTAFLQAVQFCITGQGLAVSDSYQGDSSLEVAISGFSNVGNGSVGIGHVTGQTRSGGMQGLQPVAEYHFPSTGVPMVSSGFADSQSLAMISREGQNIAGLLDQLLRQDRDRFFGLRDTLKTLIPGFKDLNIGNPQADTRRVDLVLEGGFRIPADRASTGVRLLIAFVALAFHPTPPRVILLEEPESGVHPRRLKDILHILREITQGKYGERAAQVILTTHSPYLLDHVDLETDQVLVFRREEDGSRSVEPADPERLKVFLDEFKLGEVWFNQEEEGLVRKKA